MNLHPFKRIYQLPPLIANQIAAGEVIERPASVVKELLENALDAGATSIQIELGYGGLNRIAVSDNGCGIVAEDLPLAVSAHATSKISQLDDLYAIASMGFRGEALASMASVARLVISSRTLDAAHGTRLEMNGDAPRVTPCARAPGTTVEVNDLFFNAPVRKKFLKSERQEYLAVEAVVKRFALSAPHIAIQLSHQGKQSLSLPAVARDGNLLPRLAKLMGQDFVADAIHLDVRRGDLHLHGWISGLACQRSQNDKQWIYVNQRMVRDKLLLHAFKQVYETRLHPGRHPVCILYLNLPPADVDVNVHPSKHELRFQEPRLIHDFLTSQLSQALAAVNPPPEDKVLPQQIPVEPPLQLREASQTWRSQTLPTASGAAQPQGQWLILNATHGLYLAEAPSVRLVNLKALYQTRLAKHLQRPLTSRPLLLPCRLPVASQAIEWVKTWISQCAEYGINLNYQQMQDNPDQGMIVIQSIPVDFPQLDVKALTQSLIDGGRFEGLASLLHFDGFDARLLSAAEKQALAEVLADADWAQSFQRHFDEPLCQELI